MLDRTNVNAALSALRLSSNQGNYTLAGECLEAKVAADTDQQHMKFEGSQQVSEGRGEFKPTLEDLTPLEFMCRGPGGCIYKSKHKVTGQPLIVKTVKINRRLQARIDREVDISLAMHHPNLIETYNVIVREENRFLYIVQNYYEGGDLLDHVMKLGPMRTCSELARYVVRDIARALVHMEGKGLFHGDVKLENVLFDSAPDRGGHKCHSDRPRQCCFPGVRLIDFGHSNLIDPNERTPGMFGTLEYSAPEVFSRAETECVDGCAADVWSLGITLYALLFGSLPWAQPSVENTKFATFCARYPAMHPQPPQSPGVEFSSQASAGTMVGEGLEGRAHGAVFDDVFISRLGITRQLCELFDHMLCPDPAQRWTIHQVAESPLLLSHPWFVSDVCVRGGASTPVAMVSSGADTQECVLQSTASADRAHFVSVMG